MQLGRDSLYWTSQSTGYEHAGHTTPHSWNLQFQTHTKIHLCLFQTNNFIYFIYFIISHLFNSISAWCEYFWQFQQNSLFNTVMFICNMWCILPASYTLHTLYIIHLSNSPMLTIVILVWVIKLLFINLLQQRPGFY